MRVQGQSRIERFVVVLRFIPYISGVCVCIRGLIHHLYAHADEARSTGTGVIGICEGPGMGVGKQTQVLYKRRMSHLSMG